jgi:hypothetical protein
MTNTERVTLHQRKRMGQRPVTVIVSEQEIDCPLARDYELARTDDASMTNPERVTLHYRMTESVKPASHHHTLPGQCIAEPSWPPPGIMPRRLFFGC